MPGELNIAPYLFGGASIDASGTPLTDDTLEACRNADAVLLAAVGGPNWSQANGPSPELGLLELRRELDVYANLRPAWPLPALVDASPLKPERLEGTDLLIVRELTGGIYYGERYSTGQIERIARKAFELADIKVTSVDKANVLPESKHWREVVSRVQAEEFSEIPLEHMYIDNAVAQLVHRPSQFDVILADNLFGDILSDEAGMLTGSLGVLPSASLSDGGPGIFEPVHGSAPDIAGKGIANPTAMFLSAGLMLRELGMLEAADAIEKAVNYALDEGFRTPDLGGADTTASFTKAVGSYL